MNGNNNKRLLEADDMESDGASRVEGVSDDGSRTSAKKVTPPAAMAEGPSSDVIFGISSHSPPQFISLEEIVKAANGVKNMALAHEIAVDENFKLTVEAVPESDYRGRIAVVMNQAYFDLLRERLSEDPPKYEQVFAVFEEIRQGLLACLMPHNTRTREEIEAKLDLQLMAQQANVGTLEVLPYLQYCVATMARICSPARDEDIKDMSTTTDIPELMKMILPTLQGMRVDMVNFTISAARPQIKTQSIGYERKKFAEFLAVCPDGLRNTVMWLGKHCELAKSSPTPPDMTSVAVRKLTIASLVTSGYMDLLHWDPKEPYPETCTLDAGRFSKLGETMDTVCLLGTIVLIAMSNAGPIPQGLPGFREKLKSKVKILLEDESTEPKELKERLAGIGEVVVKDLEEAIEAHSPPAPADLEEERRHISAELKALIIAQITDAANPENAIRRIVEKRVRSFLETVIDSSTASPTQVPPGLSSIQEDLTEIAATFLQLTVHNRQVFMSYYVDIIDAAFGLTPNAVAAEAASSNPTSATA